MMSASVTEYGFNPKDQGLIVPIKAVEEKEPEKTEGKKSSNKKKKQ